MQFSQSLKQNHLFRRLYRRGSSAANRYLVLYCRRNGQACNRVGLTVSAKLGHAVARNRLRRRLLSLLYSCFFFAFSTSFIFFSSASATVSITLMRA